MQLAIANAVHPILQCGLRLRDRLETGESLDWDLELSNLKRCFAALDANATVERDIFDFDFSADGNRDELDRLTRQTARYALACWLDDFLQHYSVYGANWRERTLESDLYGTNDGAAKFWQEARYAETRGDVDALEVMHLCVMLGFRGELRSKPAEVQQWATRIAAMLERSSPEWTMPASLRPTAIPSTSEGPMQRLMFRMLAVFALTIPAALVLWWRQG